MASEELRGALDARQCHAAAIPAVVMRTVLQERAEEWGVDLEDYLAQGGGPVKKKPKQTLSAWLDPVQMKKD